MKIYTRKFFSYVAIITTLCLFFYIGLRYIPEYKTAELNIDEGFFVRKTFYYDLFFIQHDVTDVNWHTRGEVTQPKIGVYLFGLGLHMAGIKDIQNKLQKVHFNQQVDGKYWWFHYGDTSPLSFPKELAGARELIWASRKITLVFSIATFLIIFWLCFEWQSIWFALLAVFLLAKNRLMFIHSRVAMTDVMQLFALYFGLFVLQRLMHTFTSSQKNKMVGYSVLLGLLCTFAAGVKVIGVLLLIFCGGYILIEAFLRHRLRIKECRSEIKSLLIIFITFITTFTYFHPYLYTNWLFHFFNIFWSRLQGTALSQLQTPNLIIATPWEAIMKIFSNTLLPQALYNNFDLGQLPIDLIVYLSGMFFLVVKFLKVRNDQKAVHPVLLLLLWNCFIFISLIFYLKVDWSRYYLPFVSSVILVQVYGISSVFLLGLKKMRKFVQIQTH